MHFGRAHSAVAAALAALLIPSAAAAEDARRVGIVVTTAVNVTADEVDELSDQLAAALTSELQVDVISGRETRRRLPADGLPDECVAKPECRRDLGERLDAAELLLLVVVRIGDRIQIDTTWTNVASGDVTSRPAIVLEPDADRAAALTAAAPSLLPNLPKARRDGDRGVPDVVVVAPVQPTERGHHMTAGSWIATGVAGASLIGGTVFALSARSKYDSLEADSCRTRPCSQDRVDAMERHALAADLLFGAGIAAGVTAVVLYLRSDTGDDATEPSPAPIEIGPGPGAVGLSIGGRF